LAIMSGVDNAVIIAFIALPRILTATKDNTSCVARAKFEYLRIA